MKMKEIRPRGERAPRHPLGCANGIQQPKSREWNNPCFNYSIFTESVIIVNRTHCITDQEAVGFLKNNYTYINRRNPFN